MDRARCGVGKEWIVLGVNGDAGEPRQFAHHRHGQLAGRAIALTTAANPSRGRLLVAFSAR
jgi:hypothetical protein